MDGEVQGRRLQQPVSRRRVLKGLLTAMAVGAVAPLAAACAQQPPAPAKPAESKPAETKPAESKPAAAQPAAAPKVESKPAEAAKPAAAGEPKRGGTLKMAILGEPPALDPTFTTATVTANTTWHMFEPLFAPNSKNQPVPLLAEKYEPASDGKKATFILRKGVQFHNDKEMTSADVVASLKRYSTMSARGKLLFERVEGIDAPDKYTVTMTFKQPSTGILPVFLMTPEPIVVPQEMAEKFAKEKFTEYIGTGPYKFVEHVPDRHIRMTRWDKYAAREDKPDGPAGKRVAYIDELVFIPVPEESVRADGVGTGEYHYANDLAPDTYDKVRSQPNVSADIGKPYYWATPHFNKKEGLFTNVKLRQAVMAAVKIEPIAAAAFGRPEFYRIGPEMAAPETPWYTDEGIDVYNKPDPEKAKALLKEAGYDGTPIRWMSTKEYFYNYSGGLAFKQQLEAVGFTVDQQVMDWATLVKRRSDSKEYDVFVTAHEAYRHPVLQPHIAAGWPGWWVSEEKDRVAAAIMSETDPKKELDLIRQLQRLQYTEVPCLKYGEYFVLRARSNKVMGMENPSDPFFWNAWLS
jgi:peptide/nickel transport system substrate-binding protein